MRTIVRVVVAAALIGSGWLAGRAQTLTDRGDFELRVEGPSGTTVVECVRGCGLIGAKDIRNPRASQMRIYDFSCTAKDRCQANVVGFLRR